MKKYLLIIAAALYSFNTTAQSASSSETYKDWNGVRASYGFGSVCASPQNISTSVSFSFPEISFGYEHGFSLSQKFPAYVILSPELAYMLGEIKYQGINSYTDLHYLSLEIPASLAFKLKCSDDFFITPYAGLKMKANLLCLLKDKNVKETTSLFSSGYGGKRVQLGMQVGAGMNISHFYAGFSYHYDITNTVEVEKIDFWSSSFRITLGYDF